MQTTLAMDTSPIAASTPIPTSTPAPTPSLSPFLSTQSQSSTQQLSPGQKRPANELDAPTTPISSGHDGSTPTPNILPMPTDDKENYSDSFSLKDDGYTVTLNPAAPVAIPTIAGIGNVVVSNGVTGQAQSQTGNGAGTAPAAKKRKLTPAEREAKQQEKEAKERQKLEEKAKKEEEKAKKEEEKRRKEAEKEEERKKREEKKKAKDEEKAAKEEEKRKKDEEKLKKERAQTKLNSFFAKPKVTGDMPFSVVSSSPTKASGEGVSTDTSEKVSEVSAYKREFPDFFLHPNTHVAPQHRFERDAQALAHLRAKIDSSFNTDTAGQIVFRPSELFRMIPYKRRRGCQSMSVKDILLQMQSLNDMPETSETAWKLQASLRQVRMKSLKFGEDVRPPYQGTYTKHLPKQTASKLMRNPFARSLPEVNYDYDSEAEWEDAEEGEELDSEDEDEGSEDGDEDMDGFLDDEDDHLANGKRRLLVGDLEPVCTGIKWQDQGSDPELQTCKLETILQSVTFPIDPFSSSYWQKPTVSDQANGLGRLGRSTWHVFMGNPASGGTVTHEGNTGTPPKRAFPAEQLGEFKTVVQDSNLTKMGLVEVLKKRFPKVSKGTLKHTLDSVATRVGQKEADKKWVCN
ncbi:putative chromatin assembly factor 1 subunit A [Aspergillus undulatus]|uniref:putative chromatin assembly factor 1 subunit A n=1 Tax=Aspergillus undulatus TaxID=1810928 RepID=UPI003CCCF0A1